MDFLFTDVKNQNIPAKEISNQQTFLHHSDLVEIVQAEIFMNQMAPLKNKISSPTLWKRFFVIRDNKKNIETKELRFLSESVNLLSISAKNIALLAGTLIRGGFFQSIVTMEGLEATRSCMEFK